MLDIKISDTVKIISDDKNYIVQKRKKILKATEKKKVGGWTEWREDGYFQDWDHISEYVLHLKIRHSDAKTLREVCSIVKAFKTPKLAK